MEQVESLRAEVARLQDAKRQALAMTDARSKGNADLLVKLARVCRELEALKSRASRRDRADLCGA